MKTKNNRCNFEVRGTDNLTQQEILKFICDNDIINVSHIHDQIIMNKRSELLKKHPFKIWEGKNGKWYTYLPDDKKGRIQISRVNKDDLDDIIVDYWKEELENPTIEDVFNEWNDRRLQLKKIVNATHLRNKQVFNRHYKYFGKKRIKNILPEEFGEFLEEQIPEHNLTAKAFANLKTITRGFLKRAKKRKLINYNVEEIFNDIDVSDIDFHKNIKEDYEEVFTEEEMPVVMEYLINHPDILNLGLLLMFVTGLRVGELAALKWEDFDDTGVKIRRSETRYSDNNGKLVFEIVEHPKTAAGIRKVVIPRDYMWIIDRLKSMNQSSEFVFVRNGERLKTFSFRNRIYLVCEKTKCVQKSPHKIRKTYGSILLDNHLDKRLVIGQMGHSDVVTTENYYHRNRKNDDTRVDIISDIPEFKITC